MQLQTLLLTAVTVSNTKEGGKLLFCCGVFFRANKIYSPMQNL